MGCAIATPRYAAPQIFTLDLKEYKDEKRKHHGARSKAMEQ